MSSQHQPLLNSCALSRFLSGFVVPTHQQFFTCSFGIVLSCTTPASIAYHSSSFANSLDGWVNSWMRGALQPSQGMRQNQLCNFCSLFQPSPVDLKWLWVLHWLWHKFSFQLPYCQKLGWPGPRFQCHCKTLNYQVKAKEADNKNTCQKRQTHQECHAPLRLLQQQVDPQDSVAESPSLYTETHSV